MDFKSLKAQLRNEIATPIAIVGLGISGNSSLRLLKSIGFSDSEIFTHDQKQTCSHPLESQLIAAQPKSLLLSPGVPIASELVQKILAGGAKLTSELELASRFLGTEKIIGITGSVGKSTVTSLIGYGLEKAGIPAFIGGNLGTPLADYAFERSENIKTAVDWVVLELSSYQLENFTSLNAAASILVSFTPNHMERYEGLEHYYATKLSLLNKTSGPKILNNSGLDLVRLKSQLLQDSQTFWTDRKDPTWKNAGLENAKLVGEHNADNIALAMKLGEVLAWPKSYTSALLEYGGLPHRLQNLGEKNGVLFLNDSKATTVASVLQALRSLQKLREQRKNTYVLLGGKDKKLPWQDLAGAKDFQAVFFGEVAELAQEQSQLEGPKFKTLAAALDDIFPRLQKGDMLVLSPGGTSFDEFKSFEDRGRYFIDRIAKW